MSIWSALLPAACSRSPQPSSTKEKAAAHGMFDHPEVFAVRIGETSFRIPKKYIHANGVSTWGKKPIVRGVADEIWLGALLPDLIASRDEPRRLSGDELNFRQLLIQVYRTSSDKKSAEEAREYVEGRVQREKWRAVVSRHDLGLTEYDRTTSSWGSLTYIPLDPEYKTPDGGKLIISCLRYDVTSRSALDCVTHYSLAPSTRISYQLSWQQLENWRKIDQAVRELLKSFNYY